MDGAPQAQATQARAAEAPTRSIVRETFYTRHGKRALDVALALTLLPLLLPVMAVIALGMVHRGHALFVQERVGRGGKRFTIYKFRTMRVDAEAFLKELCASDPAIAREWEQNQRLDPDPRVTQLGKWLRRTKLDELPQIWNILRGDMSFVGPRPFLPSQQPIYDACDDADAYYALRPGVTGPWQLDRERDKRFVVRARYDAAYARDTSAAADCAFLLRTAVVPLKLSGR
jgi:exopolysaccharide production protein ExoY